MNQLILPPLTTIYRTSAGQYFCPFSVCDQQCVSIDHLKKHYRIHSSTNYRPFKCNITNSCQYEAAQKCSVVCHIRTKHRTQLASSSENNAELGENSILTNTDLLEIENALFRNAKIVCPPKMQIQKPLLYACTLVNCSKKFIKLTHYRDHYRAHIGAKPFFCSFSKCGLTTNQKSHLLRHIHTSHFNISRKDQT